MATKLNAYLWAVLTLQVMSSAAFADSNQALQTPTRSVLLESALQGDAWSKRKLASLALAEKDYPGAYTWLSLELLQYPQLRELRGFRDRVLVPAMDVKQLSRSARMIQLMQGCGSSRATCRIAGAID